MQEQAGQLDLFAGLGMDAPKRIDAKEKRIQDARENAPEGIALVYTATEKGNSTDPHFFMSIDDAMKLCSDERSKGVLHGTRWAFFWTSLKNYCGNYWDLTLNGLDLSKFYDNGSRDALLDELGIRKMDFHEVVGLLERNGIKVKTPAMGRKEELDRFMEKNATKQELEEYRKLV